MLFSAEDQAELWHDPAWYHALSLAERLPSRPTSADRDLLHKADLAKATRLFKAWKTQPPFTHESLFTRRLASYALSEADLFTLLAEPTARVKDRISPTPDWLTTLIHAFTTSYPADEALSSFLEEATHQPLGLCLYAIRPLLCYGLASLHHSLQQLQHDYPLLPFDPQLITQAFLDNLAPELLSRLSKTIVLEMHVARLQGHLHGDTPEERFADFVHQLDQDRSILPLLLEYPVLARSLVQTIDDRAHFTGELLEHLCADWPTLCATFTPEHDPGILLSIQGGVGDTHRHGRSVQLLQFSSGLQLLYKPKPLSVDTHFQGLLAWLNERGADPPFRALILLDRGTYGWSEFVAASSCTSSDEIVRFYERQGAYLALLYALNATDLHVENIIASGEHPVLIDLETLFHTPIAGNSPTVPDAFRAIDQSVLRVGLLPQRLWSDENSAGIDISGLGGQAGQMLPRPVPIWKDTGTDQMRLSLQQVELPTSQNRPRLNDHEVTVLDYRTQLVTGFTNMYRLLSTVRDALIAEQLPHFAHDEVRLLIRPTQVYARLLTESFHPDLLRDALERDRYFDHLWNEVDFQPYLARIIEAEQRDLLRGDIPVFTAFTDCCTLFTSEHQAVESFFATPALQSAQQQLQQLDEHDLARQSWIIEASLTTLHMGPEDMIGADLSLRPHPGSTRRPISQQRLLALSTAIGKRLSELALCSDNGASWLGVNLVQENAWGLLPADIDLYNGLSGITLFLAYLGTLTDDENLTHLAHAALTSLRLRTAQYKNYLPGIGMGVFDGLCGPMYLLTHLAHLWHDPKLLQEAEELAKLLPTLIPRDDHFDIVSGSAGCILSLLNLYTAHPSQQTLEIAIQCGNHLLATAKKMPTGIGWITPKQERPLGGFSHGTAGITLSLLKLAHSTGENRFQQAALDALAYDQSLFLPAQQNWADLRTFPPSTTQPPSTAHEDAQDEQSMVAWCHGASGIGLGRLGILHDVDDASIRKDIDIALRTTAQQGLTSNHSLCHGALGNIDFLLTTVQMLNRPQDRAVLAQATASLVKSIETQGPVTGVPGGVETPGLMTGLAGIGYELLRLAKPDNVPSLLLIASP